MKITTYADLNQLQLQKLSLDHMKPVRAKLINLSKFIADNGDQIAGLTCNNKNLFSDKNGFYEEVETIASLNQIVYEYIQVAERRSLSELKTFINRCLDVIEFLFYIEYEVETTHGRKFEDLMKELGPYIQNILWKEEYCSFVTRSQNDIIIKMLEATVQMGFTNDTKQNEKNLRAKQ